MPIISPFGLDGNNNQSLSPFDIKGKGQTKIISFLEYLLIISEWAPPLCTTLSMLPLSTCWSLYFAEVWCSCSPWTYARWSLSDPYHTIFNQSLSLLISINPPYTRLSLHKPTCVRGSSSSNSRTPIFLWNNQDLTARWCINYSQLLSEVFKSFPG